jgi:site-specific recombinase XerD
MPNIVKPAPPGALSTQLREVAEQTREYVQASVPATTQRAYATDWRAFSEFCRAHKLEAMPARPETVALFATSRAGEVKPGTIRRALASIAKMHSVSRQPNPCSMEPVPSTMKGIERTHLSGTAGKAPANLAVVEKLVSAFPATTLDGIRNRALLLVGFAGAFRRSELVGLDVSDLAWSPEGVVVTVRQSKTDQAGEGQQKPIPFVQEGLCAATALRVWLTAAGIKSGPVFRPLTRSGQPRDTALNPQMVAVLIKVACERTGLDPTPYSGHSLRAGHVTEARSRGVADADTMSVTGHRRVETLNVYDRRGTPFAKTSAGAVLGQKGGK